MQPGVQRKEPDRMPSPIPSPLPNEPGPADCTKEPTTDSSAGKGRFFGARSPMPTLRIPSGLAMDAGADADTAPFLRVLIRYRRGTNSIRRGTAASAGFPNHPGRRTHGVRLDLNYPAPLIDRDEARTSASTATKD
jgi:hypothetical protein